MADRTDTTGNPISVRTISYREGGEGRTKAQKRLLMFRQQRGICAICSKPMAFKDTTLDHLVPKSFGGQNTYANLRVAHRICNQERGASMSDVFVTAAGVKALRWNVREIP